MKAVLVGIALLAFAGTTYAGGPSLKNLNVSQPERCAQWQSHLFNDLHPLPWDRWQGRRAAEVYSPGRRSHVPGGSREVGCEVV